MTLQTAVIYGSHRRERRGQANGAERRIRRGRIPGNDEQGGFR